MKSQIAVLIPAFNAEDSVGEVVEGCRVAMPEADLLVVDDGSNDRTGSIAARAGARVIRHQSNQGKGAALRTGFDAFLKADSYEAVVTLDADRQHDPADIPRFIAEFKETGAELVVGKRARWGTSMPFSRIASNGLTSFLVTARTGTPIRDSQCGFRLIGRSVVEQVGIESDGFEAETEFLIKAARLGAKISFIPIRTVYANEKSHMTNWTTTRKFISTLFREY